MAHGTTLEGIYLNIWGFGGKENWGKGRFRFYMLTAAVKEGALALHNVLSVVGSCWGLMRGIYQAVGFMYPTLDCGMHDMDIASNSSPTVRAYQIEPVENAISSSMASIAWFPSQHIFSFISFPLKTCDVRRRLYWPITLLIIFRYALQPSALPLHSKPSKPHMASACARDHNPKAHWIWLSYALVPVWPQAPVSQRATCEALMLDVSSWPRFLKVESA